MQGERRMVTVLFCDVVGSTAMAERMDPEEWAEVMNEAFGLLIAPVNRYGGTVARLLGDALLAYFGAPVAHEDDPERAVLAALAMTEDIAPFRERFRRDYGTDFDIRVGINTGRVVVGDVGSGGAEEYTVMGDAVNVAARMEQTAEPGTIRVGETTHGMVEQVFDFEALGDVEVKGKSQTVPAFRVVGRKQQRGRQRGLGGTSAPLVGRDGELGSIKLLLDDLRLGRGGIVSLIGEAGLGKSRLLEEARAEWHAGHPNHSDEAMSRFCPDERGHAERGPDEAMSSGSWQESRGVSYDSDRPFTLFIGRIRAFLGVDEADSQHEIRAKIVTGVESIPDFDGEDLVDSLQTLLSVKSEVTGSDDDDAEKLRTRLFEGVERVWRARSSVYPLVAVFEDLHWADSTSVDLILHLAKLVEEAPILIVCAFRPERRSQAWRFKQAVEVEHPHLYAEISLSPLDDGESGELIDMLLNVEGMPGEVRQSLVERAEGNPYFVEEAIRTLVDGGLIATENGRALWQHDVPLDGLQLSGGALSMVMARIDRLEEDARQTLQLASVIGRNFYGHVLKVVSDTAERIDRQLSDLQRAELILQAARTPEIEYTFKHELTREAAYGSILVRRRRQFHRRVGEAIESLFPDRLQEEATRLALHFGEAGDRERAFKYSVMAGDAAVHIYANEEAVNHFSKAVDFSRDFAPSAEELSHLYRTFGRTLEVTGQDARAIELYKQLEEIGDDRNDEALTLQAMLSQATLHATYTTEFDPAKGKDLLTRSLQLARRIGEPESESKALWNLMLLEVYGGDSNERAVEHGEAALAIALAHGLKERTAYALHDLSRAYSIMGRTAECEAALEEAGQLWRELGNLSMLGDHLSMASIYYFAKGDLARAAEVAEEASEVGGRSGGAWGKLVAFFGFATVKVEHGLFDDALSDDDWVGESAKDPDFAPGPFVGIIVSWLRLNAGDLDGSLDAAENAVERSLGLMGVRVTALMMMTGILTAGGKLDRAEEVLRQVLGADASDQRDVNGGFEMARLAVDEFYLTTGRYPEALAFAEERLAHLERFQRLGFVSDHLRFKGLALAGLGRASEAIEPLKKAVETAEQVGSLRSLWRALAAQAEVAAALGDHETAVSSRRQALDIVERIADGIADPERRRMFMALPEVGRLRAG